MPFPEEVRARIVDAIWANKPPLRLFNAIFDLLQTHLRRRYFNDAFKRYKRQRGKKVGGNDCITSNQIFRELNRGYYEHMLVGVRRVIGSSSDQLVRRKLGQDRTTYSLSAVLHELSRCECELSAQNGFDLKWLRKRNVGRWLSKTARQVRMTKDIKRTKIVLGSIGLIRRALLLEAETLTHIVNKHLAHLATEASYLDAGVSGNESFRINEADIEAVLKRIIDVYDVLEHLFSRDTEQGMSYEDRDSLRAYEHFFQVPHSDKKSMTVRSQHDRISRSWRHGSLTSILTRKDSFDRVSRKVGTRFSQ